MNFSNIYVIIYKNILHIFLFLIENWFTLILLFRTYVREIVLIRVKLDPYLPKGVKRISLMIFGHKSS